MNDIRRIEDFLNIIKESAKQGVVTTDEMVYSNLVRLGRNVRVNSNISHNFSDWINSFKNTPNINVFVQENWQYFCQFVNDDYNKITSYNMIKMYVPIDDLHINEAAKRIFNFMASNNIIHHSKIGSKVRFDDIVIRIDSKENAKKVEDFIMNDAYIKEGLMQPNPFAFNNGYISYAWDGDLSYNYTIAKYISSYIIEKQNSNVLDSVSYKDFLTYLADKYNEVFINNKNISKYMNEMRIEEDYELDNYKKVTELFLQSIMPDKNNKNFFDVYNQIVYDNHDEEQENEQVEQVKVYITSKEQAKWEEIYNLLVTKYGYEEADQRIFLFLETNNYNYFTREHGIREYIIKEKITKEMIQTMYLSMHRIKENNKTLLNTVKDTYEKYDFNQVIIALRLAMHGNYSYFTNQHGGRNAMNKQIKPEEIRGLIISYFLEKGYDITEVQKKLDDMCNEYVDLIVQEKNSIQRR